MLYPLSYEGARVQGTYQQPPTRHRDPQNLSALAVPPGDHTTTACDRSRAAVAHVRALPLTDAHRRPSTQRAHPRRSTTSGGTGQFGTDLGPRLAGARRHRTSPGGCATRSPPSHSVQVSRTAAPGALPGRTGGCAPPPTAARSTRNGWAPAHRHDLPGLPTDGAQTG